VTESTVEPQGRPLSDADEAFLGAGNLTFLFALRADGSPSGWPMTSEFRDGELTMSTYLKAPKARVCAAAGYATALVVRRHGDDLAQAVCVSAPISLRQPEPGGPVARSQNDVPGAGALAVPDHILQGVERAEQEGKRVVLAMDVTNAKVWSHPDEEAERG
jgi:hypothetical protein